MEDLLNSDEVIRTNKTDFQAGIAVVDTKTGEIRALGGGRKKKKASRSDSTMQPIHENNQVRQLNRLSITAQRLNI